jgi:hypothetical protein
MGPQLQPHFIELNDLPFLSSSKLMKYHEYKSIQTKKIPLL